MFNWRYVPVAVIAVAIAFAAARSATLGIVADQLPAETLVLDAKNPIALMKRVDSEIGVGGINLAPKDYWRPDALAALRERPLNPSALRVLGFVAASEGRQEQAQRLVAISERISRRDGLTQLWLVQDSARRDDARAVLAHVDIALSVHDSLLPIISPILLQVIEDPPYAQEFSKFVVRDRPWLRGFLTFATTNNPNPEPLADVLSLAGGLPPGADYRVHERDILWSLANARKLDRAAKLLIQLRQATPETLANGRVIGATIDPKLGPFAWSPSMDANVSSAFEAGGILRATTTPGKTGLILQRYFTLSQGGYVLTTKARSDTEGVGVNVGITVECTAKSDVLVYEAAATVSSKSTGIGSTFVIPSNCPLQLLRFTARGAESQMEGALTLSEIDIKKQN